MVRLTLSTATKLPNVLVTFSILISAMALRTSDSMLLVARLAYLLIWPHMLNRYADDKDENQAMESS